MKIFEGVNEKENQSGELEGEKIFVNKIEEGKVAENGLYHVSGEAHAE
jgi:hypothetical protein